MCVFYHNKYSFTRSLRNDLPRTDVWMTHPLLTKTEEKQEDNPKTFEKEDKERVQNKHPQSSQNVRSGI